MSKAFIRSRLMEMEELCNSVVAFLRKVRDASFGTCVYYNGPVSDHYDGNKFCNIGPSTNDTVSAGFLPVLKWLLCQRRAPWERAELQNYDKPPSKVLGNDLRISNVGHATFLIQTEGLNIITDPVWSERCSPFSFLGPKRYLPPGISFQDLPSIDAVWISHNHYDHFDVQSIVALWKVYAPRIITPLGNDAIITSYSDYIKSESYDWGESVAINPSVRFHLSPAQHWSSRKVFDRNRALWASLVIETPNGNICFIGDTAYGDGSIFRHLKAKFGSFRVAILPIGAYKPREIMQNAHMGPQEVLKAYYDLGKPSIIPSHYGVFNLAGDAQYEAVAELLELIGTQVKETDRESLRNEFRILKVGEFQYF